MAIRVYNTLSKSKENFEPVQPGKVGIYLCGPTVYKPSHIGHMVGPVIFDAVKRRQSFRGTDRIEPKRRQLRLEDASHAVGLLGRLHRRIFDEKKAIALLRGKQPGEVLLRNNQLSLQDAVADRSDESEHDGLRRPVVH